MFAELGAGEVLVTIHDWKTANIHARKHRAVSLVTVFANFDHLLATVVFRWHCAIRPRNMVRTCAVLFVLVFRDRFRNFANFLVHVWLVLGSFR